jgi:NAD+-dependent protein deacetylase sirtuin 2
MNMFKFFSSSNNKQKLPLLFEAASSGNVKQFHELYQQLLPDSSPNSNELILFSKDTNGWILLQHAAINGLVEIARTIIQHCHPKNGEIQRDLIQKMLAYEGPCGHTSFLLSLTNGYEEFACYLLENGTPVDGVTTRQRNCFYLIARSGFLTAAQLLLDQHGLEKTKILCEALDANGYTPLHAAALMGQANLCKFLVNSPLHLPINLCSRDGTNALHLACRLSSHQNSTQKSGETVDAILSSDQFDSSSHPSPSSLHDLLHAADCFGSTPLHLACCSLNLEAIRTILRYVPNVTDLIAQDNDGYHPTHILCHEFCRCVTEFNQLQKSSSESQKVLEELQEIQQKLELSIECLSLFLSVDYPLDATDYCQVTILHSLANCEPSIFLVKLLDLLFEKMECQLKEESERNWVAPLLLMRDCSGWTCLHTAYHTNPSKYEELLSSSSPPPLSSSPLDFFTFVTSHGISSSSKHSILQSLNLHLPRDQISQKIARLRCGAHNRIPLSERQAILHEDYSIRGVVEYLRRISHDHLPRVVVLCGAGISTSAGIQDFRSQDGLYSKESTRQLFSVEYLSTQPKEFYSQVKHIFLPVISGEIKPTPTHLLLKILEQKKWLTRIYSQNVDMLEYEVIQDSKLILECHGSFRRAYCFNSQCSSPDYLKTSEEMRTSFWNKIATDEIPRCSTCQQVLRPDVTFFGEPLPMEFGQSSMIDLPSCDLLLVLGTSLVVYPVASLPSMVSPSAVRVLFNREPTGCFQFLQPGNVISSTQEQSSEPGKGQPGTLQGTPQVETSSYRDVFFQGSCDVGARQFIRELQEEDTQRLFDQLIAEKCGPSSSSSTLPSSSPEPSSSLP